MGTDLKRRVSAFAFAALAALAVAVAGSFVSTPQAHAAAAGGEYCCILYSDETLVIQKDAAPDPARGPVTQVYTGLFADALKDTPAELLGVTRRDVKKVVIADTIVLTGDMQAFFEGFRSCASMEGLERIDTSQVHGMNALFSQCASLTFLDLSSWNVSNVWNMGMMFSGCRSLKTVNIAGWDTSSVTQMYRMFASCFALTSIDAAEFETGGVTAMEEMFEHCKALGSLDLSSWNVSRVVSMSGMFKGCSALTSLNLTGWNTASLGNMNNMFLGCSALTTVDVAGWNTSRVTMMEDVFNDCRSLAFLDVSRWDTSSVLSMRGLFLNCSSLSSVGVANWNTSKVTNLDSMFSGCSKLANLDVSRWNTSSVTSMQRTFLTCTMLTSIDVSGWDTSKCTNLSSMFCNCRRLVSVDASRWNTSKVTSMHETFRSCVSLESVDLSGWDVSAVGSMDHMFQNCQALRRVVLGDRFAFKSPSGLLPEPSSLLISGADGMWHSASGDAYLPSEIPANKADTYYAVARENPQWRPFVKRIAGDYANQTSALISSTAFQAGCDVVVIARDDDFADAMSATGLAGALQCPIILTNRNYLSPAAAEEIARLGAGMAIVVGGKGAIPADLETELPKLGCVEVHRVFGEYACDTSVECAKCIIEMMGPGEFIVAMGTNFQDALSMSSYAYAYGVPILLTAPWGDRHLTPEADAMVAAGSGTIWVAGGPGAVPTAAVEGKFKGRDIQRLFGYDGYETSNAIANHMVGEGLLSARYCVVACGAQGPKGTDALSGAALAGCERAPMLLVNGNPALGGVDHSSVDEGCSDGSSAYLKTHAATVEGVWVLGGSFVMPQSTLDRISGALAG